MTLPLPIDPRVEIAPGAQPDSTPDTWVFRDVSAYRRQAADIEIETGRPDESSDPEPGSMSMTVDLRDGLLSPRNPYSELYGKIGTNTPIRLRLPIMRDTFGRTVVGGLGTADTGQTYTTAGNYSVSGGVARATFATASNASEALVSGAASLDLDLVYSTSLPAVMTGASWVSAVVLRRLDSANFYRFYTEFATGGVITAKLVRTEAGAASTTADYGSTGVTYGAGTKVWTRIQAEGGLFRARVWTGTLANEPTGWPMTATMFRVEGGVFGLYQWRVAGNTNAGSLAASIDDLAVDAILWSGGVPEWPLRWDKSGQDAKAVLGAAGPLRKLDVGDDPVRSPLSLQLPRYGPVGYWPFEDGIRATRAASGVPGAPSAAVTDIGFAADSDALIGSLSMAKINSTSSSVVGRANAFSGVGFSGLFFWKYESVPAADTVMIEWRTNGTVFRWQVIANSLGFRLFGYDANGDQLLASGTITYGGLDVTKAFSFCLTIGQSGGNITWDIAWNQSGAITFVGFTATIPGAPGRVLEFRIPAPAANVGALFGHVWMGPTSLPYVTGEFVSVSSGYAGELAASRITRLAAERGIPLTVYPGVSEPLGAQRNGRFLDLVREAADADLGLLYERGGILAYVPRESRYNRPVQLQLDWTGGQLAEAPEPVDDDQRLRNRWTVRRTDGSEAVYEDRDSIARHGAIGDSIEVNIASDDRLASYAGWLTSQSTYDEPRWPVIQIDLVAHPELIPSFLTCRVGSRIRVINPKTQIAGATIDLVIEGIRQVIGRHRWEVTLSCSPAKPWDVAVWSKAGVRYGSLTTTLTADRSASATSWSITTTDRNQCWSTTASGYRWLVGGEEVLVQSVGAVSGSGPYTQTATVVRAQNGISKPQTAGTPIRMAQPARWAL